MKFTVTVKATCITITPGKEACDVLEPLINLHTYEDEFQDETKVLGFMYDEKYDTLYFHKGIDLNYIRRLLINVKIVEDPFTPYREMQYDFEEFIPPRDEDQKDCIDFLSAKNLHVKTANDSQVFLVKHGGFGKLQPYSTRIPTPTRNGYTLMGELEVGDFVFTRDGSQTMVTGIFEQGEQDVYRITFEDGRVSLCGLEHLWTVKIREEDEWVVKTTKELISSPHTQWYIPLCEPVQWDFGFDENHLVERLYSYGYVVPIHREHMSVTMAYKPWGLRIVSIEYSHREQCRCIMVDNPEHLYLTENFIVTHNTFCTGYAIGLFGAKALIIMHRETLRGQWSKSLYDLNGYPRNRVHEITSSEEFVDICYNRHNFDYDIYLMTHATFKAGVKRVGYTKPVSDFIRNLGIGVKVIDEAHLEFKDTLLMDFLFNVRRNIYLTATDGRSQRSENTIFKHVFSNATFYKKPEVNKKHPDKWVEYITIQVNTHVPHGIYQYRVNGFKGMSAVSYGKWVIQRDKKQTHFKVCKELLREIYTNEPAAKVIVFMPLIELCNECALFLNDLNYDESFKYDLTIRTINSHNTKAVNETNKGADVIVTTIQSLGTGLDIKGITDIICCSPFVSKITAQQVFWRIRYIDKKCHYYDIIDTSVQTDIFWWRSRSKMLKSMATKYIQLTWEDDDGSNQSS